MDLEFFTPDEAAAALKCAPEFLTENAAEGLFPHVVWGQGKVVFTSEDLREIADIRAVRVTALPAAASPKRPTLKPPARSGVRVIAPSPRQRNRGIE